MQKTKRKAGGIMMEGGETQLKRVSACRLKANGETVACLYRSISLHVLAILYTFNF